VATLLVDGSQIGPCLAQVRAPLENYVNVPVVVTDIGGPSPALRESKQRPLEREEESRNAKTVVAVLPGCVDLRLCDVVRRARGRMGEWLANGSS